MIIRNATPEDIPAIVSRDAGGIKEVIQNNENGILVAVENWEMLSNSIVELTLNPTQLLNFQSEARKRVVEDFSIKAMVTQLENLYKSCNPLSII